MPRRSTGVGTIPGVLTTFLEELDLTRREVADRLRVSVRTLHNVEYGRKRVDPRLLERLAALLNAASAAKYPTAPPLGLTADRFIASPEATTSLALQAIVENRPEILLSEHVPLDPSLLWRTTGDPDRIPFAGDYDLASFASHIDLCHRTMGLVGIDDVRTYQDRTNETVLFTFTASLSHHDTTALTETRVCLEFRLEENRLCRMDAMLDTELFAEFLASGRDPR